MIKDFDNIAKELGKVITLQFDYPPNGEGSLGYKGFNMYRFKTADKEKINDCFQRHAEEYKGSFNISSLAQEVITDLLDEGLIEYGGYNYRKKKKMTSI